MDGKRQFLCEAIASGLDNEALTPEDVLRYINAEVLAGYLPRHLKADLLRAALKPGERFDATFVLVTLGLDSVAAYAPVNLMWRCLAEAVGRSMSGKAEVSEGNAKGVPVAPMPSATGRKPNRAATAPNGFDVDTSVGVEGADDYDNLEETTAGEEVTVHK